MSDAARVFVSLGHPGRLSVFRLLMRYAPRGQRPTEIAAALGMKQNTLSHHLAELTQARLLKVTRVGRSLYYAVDLQQTEALVDYLTLDLVRGRPDVLASVTGLSRSPRTRLCNVLFICSANSARSIMAEAILSKLGNARFTAFSAGTAVGRGVNPQTVDILRRKGHSTDGLSSKPLERFQQHGAPPMDFVFTVCDMSAAEECPPWPGHPLTGHWGLPDPARATGSQTERAKAFDLTYEALRRRIEAFAGLPFAALDRRELQARIDAIDAHALTQEKADP